MTRIGGMVSTVQQGMSKKNGKAYAMVTLEDLEGTFSMLLFNENYDKFRELLVPQKALLIVGEVKTPTVNGLPQYAVLGRSAVDKVLPPR